MTQSPPQRVIITGAATGIGWAMASLFCRQGARVVLMDIDAAQVQARADRLAGEGLGAMGLAMDVSDPESVRKACDRAVEFLGAVDVLINNAAAFTPRATVTELTVADWHQAIAVNLTGAFLMCRAVIPGMQRLGRGVIINVASQLGSVASTGRAPYCAAKGGLIQLTKALALDHAQEGIRVNSLSPGAVLTDRLTKTFGSVDEAVSVLAPKHPMGRLGQTDEIARAALFLAGDGASFMTGADLLVDGGYNAQ